MKSKNKLILLILIILLGAGISWHFELTSKITTESFKAFINGFGRLGPVIYIVSYILTSLILFPAALLSTSAGFIWGPYLGTFYTVIGASLSAIVPFYLARTLGRESAENMMKGNAQICDNLVSENGFFAVLIARLIPVLPWDLINYGSGFCGIKTRDYLLATVVGIIPGSFAYNMAGASLGKPLDPRQIALILAIFGVLSVGGLLYKLFYLPRQKMARYDFDIGIIGAGAAGLSACVGATGLGARTLLIDKSADNQFGGDCLKTGCVPSKALIKTAELRHYVSRLADFALPTVDYPPVNMQDITSRIKNIQKSIGRNDLRERFENLGATVIQGKASFIDANKVTVNDQIVSANIWLVCTGSVPFVPPIIGIDKVKYLTSDSIFDLEELPDKLIVIGGGPIGVELAQAFLRLGSKVAIIDMADRILAVEDPEIAEPVINALKKEGAEIINNAKILGLNTESDRIRVTIEKDGNNQIIDGSHILIATGRKADLTLLQLENAGVKTEKGAIVTDKHMRTSVNNIFACGDSNGKFQFTHVAGAEASVAVANGLLGIPKSMNYDSAPWCTFTDPEVASIGLNRRMAEQRKLDFETIQVPFSEVDRAETESETNGFARVLLDKKGRLLGAQIVGQHAGELIHLLIPFVAANKKLTEAAKEIVIYPCRADYLKKLQSEYLKKRFFNDTWRSRLQKIFGFRGPRQI